MAADDQSSEGGAGAAPVPCSACRGSGQVISNLGGSSSRVECPWCDGGGVRLADHDAQAQRRGGAAKHQPGGPLEPGPGGGQAA